MFNRPPILSSIKPVKYLYLLNFILLLLGAYVLLLLGDAIAKEYVYDKFHKNYKSTYKLNFTLTVHGQPSALSLAPGIHWDEFKEQFDVVNGITKFNEVDAKLVFGYKGKNIVVDKVLKANSGFFDVFSFPLLEGDQNTALDGTSSVVISKNLSNKLFPDHSGLGQSIVINDENFLVTGVFKKIPEHSSLQFDALMSYSQLDFIRENWSYVFLTLKEGTNLANFQQNVTDWVKKGMAGFYDESVVDINIGVIPFSSLHLSESLLFDLDKANLNVLYLRKVLLAILFLFILFNYTINLVLITQRRMKTYAVKNIFGKTKIQLIQNLLLESLLLIIATSIVAYLMIAFTIGELGPFGLSGPIEWSIPYLFFLAFLLITLTCIPVIFPSLLIFRLKPREALARKYQGITKFQSLVTLSIQVFVTLIIMNVTMGISRQIGFLLHKNLGFETENIIVLNTYESTQINDNTKGFIHELRSLSNVSSVTTTLKASLPGTRTDVDVGLSNFEYGKTRKYDVLEVGENFIETFNIQLTEGRNLDFTNHQNEILVNEELVKKYDLEDPINSTFNGSRIVGIVNNFHYTSLHKKIMPLVIGKNQKADNIIIKVNNGSSMPDLLKTIEGLSEKYFDGIKLEYHFLEDMVDKVYLEELKLSAMLTFYFYLLIALVSLGLFSVSLYEISRNQNEMTVRKIYGAGMKDLFLHLVKTPAVLLIITWIASIPISYIILGNWLTNFTYKVSNNYYLYLTNGLSIILLVGIIFIAGFYIKVVRTSGFLTFHKG